MVAGSYLGNSCQDLSTCNTLSSFQSVSTIELIARYRTKHSHQRVLENMIGMNRLSRGVVMLAGSWETPGIIPPLSRKATTSSGLYCYSQCCRIPLQWSANNAANGSYLEFHDRGVAISDAIFSPFMLNISGHRWRLSMILQQYRILYFLSNKMDVFYVPNLLILYDLLQNEVVISSYVDRASKLLRKIT